MTQVNQHSTYMKNFSVVIIAASMLIVACSQHGQEEAKGKVSQKEATHQNDSVKVFIAKLDSVKKTISLPGELLPYENAQIRAKMQGYIRKVMADIGSRVYKGQELALIDAPEINTRVQELTEKVNAAKARYHSSKDYYARLSIASQSDGVIAPLELERVRNQLVADSSDFTAAMLAAKSYRQVGNYLAVIAPYDGIITQRNIVVGSFVGNPGDKPLFELENNQLLRLQVAVPEIYSAAILANHAAELSTRSLPDKKIKANLVRKSGSIANETRTETWEFEIPNPGGELKPGSYADVKLQFLRTQPSITVPVSAIVTTQEKKFVIKVSAHTTQWLDIRNGFNLGDRQEIFSEVSPGDTLVIKATEEFKPGTLVVVKF